MIIARPGRQLTVKFDQIMFAISPCVLPFTFLQKYFLQGRITNGKRGLILATIDAFYAFLKEAKLWKSIL